MKRFLTACFSAVVFAACSGGGGGGGAAPGGGTTATTPAAPANVAVSAGNKQTAISWDAVSGADSYNIYWKLASGVTLTDTKIAGVTSGLTHTALTNGFTYHYAVTAVNAAGESALSSEVSAMAKMPAGAFTKEVALSSTTGANTGLFASSNLFRHYQLLYKPADVAGSGDINSLSFRLATASAGATCSNVTIKLGQTDVAELGAAGTYMGLTINHGRGSAVTVLNDTTVAIPAGAAGDYFTIPLSTPFHYNGIDNLVVDITRTTNCSSGVSLRMGTGTTAYTALAYSDSSADPDTVLTTSDNVLHAKFNFAGGDDIAVHVSSNSAYFPFNGTTTTGRKVQLLYQASEINGSGPLTGIAFPAFIPTTAAAYTINVKLGHTNLTALTDTFENNFNVGTPVTVADAVNFSVPAGVPAGSYVWISLPNGPFSYNGTNNLIVEIEVTSASSDRFYLQAGNSGGSRLIATGASTWVDDYHYSIKFRFAGGPVDVIGPDDGGVFVFNDSAAGSQFLLRSAELGAPGVINKLACRLYIASVAASYPNFTVTLAHRTQSTLDAVDADNIAGGALVYNGIFTIPAGLRRGDWVEIPFSTPFNYNGIDNLVVQATTGAGSSLNACQISGADATWFADRYNFFGSGTANFRGVFKFWVY